MVSIEALTAFNQFDGLVQTLYQLQDWQFSLIIFGASIIFAAVAERTLLYSLKRIFAYSSIDIDSTVINALKLPLYASALFIGVSIATEPLSFLNSVRSTIDSTLMTILGLIWLRGLLQIGNGIVKPLVASRLDKEVGPIVENIWSVVSVLLVGISIVKAWGINITPFLASAGLLGVVLGFAAKDTIANFFGSIALYADQTYQTGDYIVLQDGTEGTVRDVSIRSTTLGTRDGDKVTIPNSKLNEATVINHSEPRPRRRLRLPVGVSYDADPTRVKEVLETVATNEELVVESPEAKIRFREFGDSALKFEVHAWIQDPHDLIEVQDRINTKMYTALAENNITVPFPQRDVHMKQNNSEQTN